MDFITTIVVVGIGIYLYIKYWANDSEKNVRTLGEYYQKQLERFKVFYGEFPQASPEKNIVKEYENLIKRLGKSYEDYLHLLEKYRHARITQQWNLRQDWRVYLEAHKDIQHTDIDYGADLNNKLLQKSRERKYRALIRLDEIEKRFKKLNYEKQT